MLNVWQHRNLQKVVRDNVVNVERPALVKKRKKLINMAALAPVQVSPLIKVIE